MQRLHKVSLGAAVLGAVALLVVLLLGVYGLLASAFFSTTP